MGKPVDPAYYRRWRAAHPEYRLRQNLLRNARRAARGRGDRSSEYARKVERARRRRGDNGWVVEDHPILEMARAAALEVVRPDRRTVFYRPTYEDAVGEAALAIVELRSPVEAARAFVKRERWLSVATAPLREDLV